MKQLIVALLALVTTFGCTNSGNQKSTSLQVDTTMVSTLDDTSEITVYYFHGKQRCRTCLAVGKIAKETIEKAFADNRNVRFVEVNTSEKDSKALVDKYEVAWNALLVSKGEHSEDLTEQAFASAIDNPEKLSEDIKTTIELMMAEKGTHGVSSEHHR